MLKQIIFIFALFAQIFLCAYPARAEYESVYQYYVDAGLDALYSEDYDSALFYFKTAHAVDPSRSSPQQYIKIVMRLKEGRIKVVPKDLNAVKLEVLSNENSVIQPALKNSKINENQAVTRGSNDEDIRAATNPPTVTSPDNPSSKTDNKQSGSSSPQIISIKGKQTEIDHAVVRPGEKSSLKKSGQDPRSKSKSFLSYFRSKFPEDKNKAKYRKQKTAQSAKAVEIAKIKPKSRLNPQTKRDLLQSTQREGNGNIRNLQDDQVIALNNDLWSHQKDRILQINMGKSVIFIGKSISKYLVTREDSLEVTRLDANRLRVKATQRGDVIFYIWDNKGRWTLNLKCEYQYQDNLYAKLNLKEEEVSPFRLDYANSWSTFHKGPDLGDMTRQNIVFTNWMGIAGDTPYGHFDASADSYMYPNDTAIIGQRMGLSDGKIGPFKEFRLRLWDTSQRLSDLSLPGRNFRGLKLDSYAFDHKILYSYFHGRDQYNSIYSGTTLLHSRSYIEGFRLTLAPDHPNQYTFNYAHGYGSARQKDYNSEAYALESKQKFLDWVLNEELGYDENVFGFVMRSKFRQKNLDMDMNFTSIDKKYQTVYGQPSGVGQISGQWNMSWRPKDYLLSGYLNLYRDYILPNPDKPSLVNIDMTGSIGKPINESSSWNFGASYMNTPQTISPRQFLQINGGYTKSIDLASHNLLMSLTQTDQWSRNKFSPNSDYDRYSLHTGFRMDLLRNLYLTMGYDLILVREVLNNRTSTPGSYQAGLSYNTPLLSDKIYLNSDLIYQQESQSKSTFSFLAGEDSLRHNISLTYRPQKDLEVYFDSNLRRVWPHNVTSGDGYYDWNLTIGSRAGWDLPFRWNPTGQIWGTVYKDFNGNGLQDPDEPGLPGIKVVSGKYETITNENGEYALKITAKKSTISLDFRTIPQGFVFSTALSRDINIENGKAVKVNFGLTSRSGIYGIAYVDLNNNGKPDFGDIFQGNIVIRLDKNDITKTDGAGAYFFEDIKPGKHKLTIDVNSIPIRYLPAVKIKSEIVLEEGITYVYNILLIENRNLEQP